MNFWEFKEDHSRGYYLPRSNRKARQEGGSMVYALAYLIRSLCRLAWQILTGLISLLYIIGIKLFQRTR